MCEFCETGILSEENKLLLEYGPPDFTEIRIVKNDGEFETDWDGTVRHEKFKKDDIWIHSNSSEGDSWFKFNYCPMCGKPLNKKVSSAELYDQFITQWCKEHKEPNK